MIFLAKKQAPIQVSAVWSGFARMSSCEQCEDFKTIENSIFFSTRKNLMVGIGLLHGMNKDELKAILSHEFGHFSKQTMKVGSITYRLLLIIRGMIEFVQEEQLEASFSRANDDSWEKWFHLCWYLLHQTFLDDILTDAFCFQSFGNSLLVIIQFLIVEYHVSVFL